MAHYHKKKASQPVCGEPHCSIKLSGIKALRPKAAARVNAHSRTVARPYGGVLCMTCVRQKYVGGSWVTLGGGVVAKLLCLL